MTDISLRQIQAIIAVLRGRLVHPRRAARERHPVRHLPACRRGRTRTRPAAVRAHRGGVTPTPAGQRYYKRCIEAVGRLESAHEEVREFAVRSRRRSAHRADADHDARGARADARTVHAALSRRAAAHRRGLQRPADRHGARRRTRFRRGADLRRPRRTEVAADRARPRDAGVESATCGFKHAGADPAEGLRAAEDHRAEPRQRAPAQHRNLSADPRRRSRRHDRDGRHDRDDSSSSRAPTGSRSCRDCSASPTSTATSASSTRSTIRRCSPNSSSSRRRGARCRSQARLFLEMFEAEIERIQQVWARTIPPTMFPERPAQPPARAGHAEA